MSWDEIPLRRIFRIANGGTPKSEEQYWNGEIPWATPVDVGFVDGDYLTSTQRSLTKKGVLAGSRTVPGESIIISTRAPIGYVAQTTQEMAFNQGCRGLVPTAPADIRYFRYQLLALRDELIGRGAGSTFMELSTDALAAVPMTYPPLDEQRRIADFLDAETAHIDQLRVLQTSVLERLDQRDRATRDGFIESLIGQVGELPLRRYATKIEQGSSPSCESYPRESGEWGVIKLSAVKGGRFFPGENKRLPDDVEPMRQYELRNGDLLVSRANTPEMVGDVAVVEYAGHGLLLPDLIYRIGISREIRADFAAQVILSTRVRSLIQATARGSSQSMVKLRGEDIREWPVPRANEQQQVALVSAVGGQLESSATLKAAVGRQLAMLAERRLALITAAVTGKIDVTAACGLSMTGGPAV